MDVFGNIYNDFKKLFETIRQKDIKLSKRIMSIVGMLLLLFIIIPIGINFLSMIEIQQFGSILINISEINLENSSKIFQNEYDRLETYMSNCNLPITEFKKLVIGIIQKPFVEGIRIENINLNPLITYIGFAFKIDIFMQISIWNMVPLSLFSLFISFFAEKGKFSKLVSVLMFFLGSTIFSAIYSTIIAYIFSCLCFVIIISPEFTQITICLLSILLQVFIIYKLIKSGTK